MQRLISFHGREKGCSASFPIFPRSFTIFFNGDSIRRQLISIGRLGCDKEEARTFIRGRPSCEFAGLLSRRWQSFRETAQEKQESIIAASFLYR